MFFINLVKQLAGDSVVASANNYNNACGAGAVAADGVDGGAFGYDGGGGDFDVSVCALK